MKLFEKKESNIQKKLTPGKWIWIVVLGAIFLFSCCYMYTDLPFSSAAGLRVWNSIADGHLELFYWSDYPGVPNSVLADGSAGGEYDFLIYFIFAIYNFPLWIWEKLTGLSFVSFIITKVYTKGIIWLFSGLSAYLIYKIAIACGTKKENAIWAPFLFLSSALFFTANVTIGGYDIISVTFSLWGIYGYIKKNNKCFILAFAIAVATKLFAFWLFIPLLLLREKNIWKIILRNIEVLLAIIIPKIYFAVGSHLSIEKAAQQATETASQSTEYTTAVNDVIAHSNIVNESLFPTDRLMNYTFIPYANMALFFIGMFTIWICCYLIKRELGEKEVIYVCALSMATFFLTAKIHPYWIILLVPYLVLLIVFNPNQIKDNLFLEILISIGYVFNKVILYYWCFGMNLIENMVSPSYQFNYDKEVVSTGNYSAELLFRKLSEKVGIYEDNMAHTFSALFVVAIIIFLYRNRPTQLLHSDDAMIGEVKGMRRVIYWRIALTLLVAVLPIIGLILYCSPYEWIQY